MTDAQSPSRGVLFDFGGVLTSSVLRGLAEFGESLGGDRRLVLGLLAHDPVASRALAEHEEGRLDDEGFEAALADALRSAGLEVAPDGLLARIQGHFRRDETMVGLVAQVRSLGFPVGLISNSLGRDCYAGYDLGAMFDGQAISSVEGVRKPSRRLYEIACERIGLAPDEVVLVDDLRQNVDAAARLGIRGIVHRDAETTRAALAALLDRPLPLPPPLPPASVPSSSSGRLDTCRHAHSTGEEVEDGTGHAVSTRGPAVALDLEALGTWLREQGIPVEGALTAERVGLGHSNLTYRARDEASGHWVVRRPPLGRLLPSAHDVLREARVMSALAGQDVPVPQVVGACAEGAVADVPVVVMEDVEGLVVDRLPVAEALPVEVRRAVGLRMARTLAAVHRVDVEAVGLGDFGSRAPYAARQLRRWSRQWEASRTRDLPALDALTDLLQAHVPLHTGISLVHGDFHLRNVIVDPASGDLRAVLDWELSTLGDPLADLGSTLAYWPEAGDPAYGIFAASARPGFPTRAELTQAYAEVSGADLTDLPFWHVLGIWKVAVIAEGVHRRVRDEPTNAATGETATAETVDALVAHAWDVARDSGLAR